MNACQKERIALLRAEGKSYNCIADTLDLSINTVKSYCRRNNMGGTGLMTSEPLGCNCCSHCGAKLKQSTGKKQKRFCSDQCRMAWWKAHPEALQRKAIYSIVCAHCQESFESYGNKNRKYCSRGCYGQSKVVRHE